MTRLVPRAAGLALVALSLSTAPAQSSQIANLPPQPVGVADGDLFDITIGQVRTVSFSFESPEPGQITTVTIDDIDGVVQDFRSTPGNPAAVEVDLFVAGGLGSAGEYAFEVTATDDGEPAESVTLQLTASAGDPPAVACTPTAPLNLEAFVENGGGGPSAVTAYFQLYVASATPVDLDGCTLVLFDGFGDVTTVDALTDVLAPFSDTEFFYPNAAFSSPAGGFAIVQGAAAVGDALPDVLTANAFVLGAVYDAGGQDLFSYKNESDPTARLAGFVAAAAARRQNQPPVPVGVADGDVITGFAGERVTASFSFESPEPGQTTTVTVDDLDGSIADVRSTPGNVATVEIDFFVDGSGAGDKDYAFEVTATDDGTPAESVTLALTFGPSDPPPATCDGDATLSVFPGYTTDGVETLGLFVSFQGGVDMTGCTLVGFDALGTAISALPLTDFLPGPQDNTYSNAAAPDNLLLPLPLNTFADGTGAFVLVRGSAAVGDGIAHVIQETEFVLGGVYDPTKADEFSSQSISDPIARRAAFIAALEASLGIVVPDPALQCSRATPVTFDSSDDFDADGDNPTYGEFIDLVIMGGRELPGVVDLSTCSFATFDPFTERVTYTTPTTGFISEVADIYTIANQNGSLTIPPGSIPDGPGAIVLLEGTTTVGATVQDVLPNVVAAVVYRTEDDVVASVGGGSTGAQRAAFAEALVGFAVSGEDGADRVDLAVTAAPNPVRARSAVAFGLAEAGDVRVSVFDALGREVAVLAEGPYGAGRHEVAFEARGLPAGVYIVRVVVGAEARATRVTVAR